MRRLAWNLGEVFTPGALIVAFASVVVSAILDADVVMHGAGLALLIDAVHAHIGRKLREG